MKPKERQLKIADIIRKEGQATVDQLVEIFKSSPETIRRDLSALTLSGKVQKIHGGAKYPRMHGEEGPFQHRMSKNISAKRHIAEKACQLISSGDTLMINAGSTSVFFAEELIKLSKLTIFTNSLDITKIIGTQNGNKVYLLGGEYSQDNHETLGAIAISQLQNFHAQHLILPIGCIDKTIGITDYDASDVAVSQAMLEHVENSIILADSSKFNRAAPFIIGKLEQFDKLVCEKYPEEPLATALLENNVEIIC